MSDGEFGLLEAVSVALGGMIGGGIYAVLGVVTGIAGAATWVAFGLAGAVAACAAYSYVGLNRLVTGAAGGEQVPSRGADGPGDDATDEPGDDAIVEPGDDAGDGGGPEAGGIGAGRGGGAVTFVHALVGNPTLAGMTGWTLLVGYVGSMAMYAVAFGEFAVALPGIPGAVGGVPARPVVSVLAVVGFVALNLQGARATGTAEAVLVAGKVAILLALGAGGLAYVALARGEAVPLGGGTVLGPEPVMAAAVAFVAFQGWQLLFYDQERLADPERTLPRAVYLAIPASVAIYALVAVATYALVPGALESHPHTALSTAGGTVAGAVGLAGVGAAAVSVSALFSTGSAINATLFSAGHFARRLLAADLLPDRLGDAGTAGVPTRSVLALGTITAGLAVVGSLAAITAFASLAFIAVFGGVSALALARREAADLAATPPAVGTVGSVGFAVLMGYHLYVAERGTFYAVLAIAAAVLAAEVLYFERELIEAELPGVEPAGE